MEYLSLVDENDNVIRKASIKEVYEKFLTHRLVHVFCVDENGMIALQLRSKTKSFFSSSWTSSGSGHVQFGEEYIGAAKRELYEEVGVKGELEFLGKDLYEDMKYQVGLKKFIGSFKCVVSSDVKFKIDEREVEKVLFFTIDEIKNMIDKGEKFHPECIYLLNKYFF